MSRSLRYLAGSFAVFCCCALTVQAETVAHWAFNEGSGQTTANAVGSSTMALQLGSTSDPDANDPTWVSGGINGAANNTYLLNSGWTAADETALSLAGGSFTIETIVNPDSFPVASAFGDRAMGLVYYRDNASNIKYLMRVAGDSTGSHTQVAFYNADNTTIYYNTDQTNASAFINTGDTFLMTPGTSYYIAATFDNNAGTLELRVRDMSNGQTATASTAWTAHSAIDASPDILFYGAAESAARSFDGSMYDLRISNAVVPDALRLYNGTFFPGDANNDGMVNLADLQILGDNWQSTTATWAEADFTSDGAVNLADLQILGDNWGFGVSADLSFDEALAQVAIPEPATCLMLGAGSLLLVLRKR